jgi:hypothetical protein
MKTIFFTIFIVLFLAACKKESKLNYDHVNFDALRGQENYQPDTTEEEVPNLLNKVVLPEIREFPKIANKKLLMEKLRKLIGLTDTTMHFPEEEILNYRKVDIRGSKAKLVLLEYRYAKDWASVEFPWKCQFIFKEDGALIETLNGYKYRFINIFPDEKPFLVIINSTARGNGSHSIYKFSNDSLINMLNYSVLFFPKTYDEISCESFANVPAELKITVKDYNKDGYNDLIFTGSIIYDTIQECVSEREYNGKEKVKLTFIYNKRYDVFTSLEKSMSLEDLLAKKR